MAKTIIYANIGHDWPEILFNPRLSVLVFQASEDWGELSWINLHFLNSVNETAPLEIGNGDKPRRKMWKHLFPSFSLCQALHLQHPFLHISTCSSFTSDWLSLRTLSFSSRQREDWLPVAGTPWCLLSCYGLCRFSSTTVTKCNLHNY